MEGPFEGDRSDGVMNSSPFKWGVVRVFAGGGVMDSTDPRLTPPSAYDAATSPFEWGGKDS